MHDKIQWSASMGVMMLVEQWVLFPCGQIERERDKQI
jgi:hypothetical protein